jgi:hypothetical protein
MDAIFGLGKGTLKEGTLKRIRNIPQSNFPIAMSVA